MRLEALDRVEDEEEEDAEDEHRLRVALPVLLLTPVGADEPAVAALERVEPRAAEARRRVDTRHVEPERVRERDQHDRVDADLRDALAHLEAFPAEERVDEIGEHHECDRQADDVARAHTRSRTQSKR